MANKINDEKFWERANGYGIFLHEYDNKYSLQAGKKTDNGAYTDWVFTSEWSKGEGGFVPGDKKRPMGVYLGPVEDAIKALEFFIQELGGRDAPGEIPEEDILF